MSGITPDVVAVFSFNSVEKHFKMSGITPALKKLNEGNVEKHFKMSGITPFYPVQLSISLVENISKLFNKIFYLKIN